ncbi:squalene synthase HpnC [Methylophaga thiooxydans]|uniref:squalene synthase HpnC n=1 Tax=Methylophaga thiooxydans TaxID=392484 RepID=UPI0023544A79|nr:squalene synthase HpnC [Methylophaga thiooxydans]
MITKSELDNAYRFCQQLAQSHYENFPVASLLLPKRLRKPVSVIYAFSRTADDFADEGSESESTRLEQLEQYSTALKQISADNYQCNAPIFIALQDVIQQHQLPIGLFEDLLSAFKQDVVKSRYANFDEILDYCRFSANPVGRLLLYLNGSPSQQQLQQSDAICSALQLINFYQDIVQDYTEQDRIYIPQNELAATGLKESDLIQPDSEKIAPLIRSLYQRTADMMQAGYPLGASLTGRLGWEVRAMTLGGIQTLALLRQQSDRSLLTRPRLKKTTLFGIMLRSARKKQYMKRCQQLLLP